MTKESTSVVNFYYNKTNRDIDKENALLGLCKKYNIEDVKYYGINPNLSEKDALLDCNLQLILENKLIDCLPLLLVNNTFVYF